ncbi:MAG: hypothetical protein ACYTBP_14400 [Planctomycetota bacterium]|jgi:hypothetical protein
MRKLVFTLFCMVLCVLFVIITQEAGGIGNSAAVLASSAFQNPVPAAPAKKSKPISIIPSSIEFHASLGQKKIKTQNLSFWTDKKGRNIQIAESCDWLTVSETKGRINKLTLSVDPNGLEKGLYTTELTIFDANDPAVSEDVPVTISVGDTLNVPSTPYPTIQSAINDANDYDIIVVADGTYTGAGNRDITFLGKLITVTSENGPDTCIIDCQGTPTETHRGFSFTNGETRQTLLAGFTIKNGYLTSGNGAGISCGNSSPTISNCIIIDNINTGGHGGGISCGNADPKIIECIITSNEANYAGGR